MFQQGQAFDVFKLLIAAVVAIALLAVLIPIITGIPPFGQNDPTNTAIREVKNGLSRVSQHILSDEVIFSKSSSLNSKAISAGSSGLSENQVCVSAGEFFRDSDFKDRGNGIVEYLGNSSKRTRLSVLCDAGTSLPQDFSDYQLDASWISSCGCKSDTGTCCVVAIRKT